VEWIVIGHGRHRFLHALACHRGGVPAAAVLAALKYRALRPWARAQDFCRKFLSFGMSAAAHPTPKPTRPTNADDVWQAALKFRFL